jgi:putative ABC transport system permease protein
MSNHIRLALRVLARRKVFTAISLVGITLTLVVLVLAAAVFDSVFAAGAPQSKLDRMLLVPTVSRFGPNTTRTSNPGHGFHEAVTSKLTGVEDITLFTSAQESVAYFGTSRINVQWRRTDDRYWHVHDFHFLEGSSFSALDHQNANRVAVIGQSLRHSIFGNAPALGRSINISGLQYRVVGVVPDTPISRATAYADVWTPLGPPTVNERHALMGDLSIVVLAKSRGDFPRLKQQFAELLKLVPNDDPKVFTGIRSGLDTQFEALARGVTGNEFGERGPIFVVGVMTLVALLFMLLPALNLITLNLSRTLERAPEIGVRRAFGAPRSSLVRQFVFENVVLTVIGGLASFVLAAILLAALNASGALPDTHFTVNLRVLGYGLIFAVAFGVLSGAWPAWKMSRLNPVDALRGGAL